MQLTKQTDYAFRVLIYLAQVKEAEVVRISQISEYYAISQHHIAKIVATLSKQGWVVSVRGKGGGVSLGQSAMSINLGDVVKLFEPSLAPVNCNKPVCRILASCALRGLLDNAMQAFINTLSGHTLEDIVK